MMLRKSLWKMFTFAFLLVIVPCRSLIRPEEIVYLQKPVLTLNPSFGQFITGEKITLKCRCYCPATRIEYYSLSTNNVLKEYDINKCNRPFEDLLAVDKGGTYTCRCLAVGNGQWTESDHSSPVQIHIGDELSPPSIKKVPESGEKANTADVHISCQGEIRPTGGTFHLCKGQNRTCVQTRNVNVSNVIFTINTLENNSTGNYSCQYETDVPQGRKNSSFSEYVEIVAKCQDGRRLQQVRAQMFAISVGCGALIVILLIVALISFFIVKRGRKKRQNLVRISTTTDVERRHGNKNCKYDNADTASLSNRVVSMHFSILTQLLPCVLKCDQMSIAPILAN
ncbi:uncharacterized protein [Scyliorhinus torazame]|uniref:uncharacterized protein n=1 Tax=Scyliorhinus torazame TaxID=75743 RepID=UPI003B5CC4A3